MKDGIDFRLIERLAQLNREKLPERLFFAKGTGAYGYFQPYMPMSDYTTAAFLQNIDLQTPVFVRFATFSGSKGSADTVRDLREFSVRFYTGQGNYDLMGTSLPVFYINDPANFEGLLAALRPARESNLVNANRFWAYIADHPETLNIILWLFTDLGTVKSYRTMNGYSNHAYVWVNAKERKHLIRYEWIPHSGSRTVTRQEAEFLAGFDPDHAARDLYETISEGNEIVYELAVQLIPWDSRHDNTANLFDITRAWPDSVGEKFKVGRLILNRNPEDYMLEVEQSAFSPGNLVPGISLSEDAMLQCMVFVHNDGNRYRLGNGFEQLAVNRSKGNFQNPQTATDAYSGEYSLKNNEPIDPGADIYQQPGDRYRSLVEKEKSRLSDNILENLMFVDDEIQEKIVRHFLRVDGEFGRRIENGLSY